MGIELEAASKDNFFKECCYKVIFGKWAEAGEESGVRRETLIDMGDVIVCVLIRISQ